jgi:hypothetical protein
MQMLTAKWRRVSGQRKQSRRAKRNHQDLSTIEKALPQGGQHLNSVCFIGQISDEQAHKEAHAIEDWIEPIWQGREEPAQAESSFRNPVTKACFEDYFAGQQYPLSVIRSLKL